MVQVFVGLGSNIDREENIRGAIKELQACYGQLLLSSVYETIPYGFEGENFYNLVAGFMTDETIENVAETLRTLEYRFGRTLKEKRFAPRTLDIDLLLYGDLVVDEGSIKLPRKDILEYSFVLCPLAEIAPELEHPVVHKTYQQLWLEFDGLKDNLWKIKLDAGSNK